jgi:hypothetical protein
MAGLQEAVVQRDTEIKKLSIELKESKALSTSLTEELEHEKTKNKENEVKVTEYVSQIKFLKDSALELQKNLAKTDLKCS